MRHPVVAGLACLMAAVAVSAPAFAAYGGQGGPAPLLAAGIPAFIAVGGGALWSRLRKRGKK